MDKPLDNRNLPANNFRIDRDFAKNPTVFRNFDDPRLAMSIFAYFYLEFKNGRFDLFDRLRIDPYKFGEEMDYKRAELFRKVDNPVQLSNLKPNEVARLRDSDTTLFETKFENTIYQMMAQNILFSQPVGDTANHRVQRVASQQILTSVDIYTDKNNKSKKYYDIVVHKTFLAMLSSYFVNIERNTFIITRDSNLSALYFYLTDVHQYCLGQNIKHFDNVTFDFLCDLAEISAKQEPSQKKKYLKKKFDAIITKVPDLKLKLEFVKNGNYKYKPIIVCEGAASSKEEKLERAININQDKVTYCIVELKGAWKDCFASLYPQYTESPEYLQMKFEDWLKADVNIDQKCILLLQVMTKYFPKSEFVQLVKGRSMSLFKSNYKAMFDYIIINNDLPKSGLF
jgi:hypothetical protein